MDCTVAQFLEHFEAATVLSLKMCALTRIPWLTQNVFTASSHCHR